MTRPNHEDNQYKATGSVQDSLKAAAPTTSNISNRFTELDAILVAYGCLEAKQALTAYIQQECNRARIDELERIHLNEGQFKEILDRLTELYKLKDLNQGGEDE